VPKRIVHNPTNSTSEKGKKYHVWKEQQLFTFFAGKPISIMNLLENKVAIITGAARGIGEGIAIKFAQNGAHIAFTYVSDSSAEKATALEEKLRSFGVKAKAWKSNAGEFSQCESFVNDVIKEFGTVDICVNNAGISKDNLLLRMGPDQWDEVIRVNLTVFSI
jgi:3-oxoacyl-[acyl-carrier protein] reductase